MVHRGATNLTRGTTKLGSGVKPFLRALLVAGVVASLGFFVRSWLPPLLDFAGANADTIEGMAGIVQLSIWGFAGVVFVFLWIGGWASLRGLFVRGPESVPQVTQDERGVNLGGEVRAPVTTGDHNRVDVTYGDRITVEGDEELYRRILGSDPRSTPPAERPPAPQAFTGRERELSELKVRLVGDNGSGGPAGESTVVVTGIPGVGKTALATLVVSDRGIRENFPDGTLWVSLGPSPDVVEELDAVARRLGGASSEKPPRNLAEAQTRVSSLLSDKSVLFVVDDVYDTADAAALRVAGARGVTFVTSRDREVALQLAPSDPGPLVLEELDENDALLLLAELAPGVVERRRTECEELVRELGGLPLALRVAGGLLAAEEQIGWGVEDLLARLREGREVLGSDVPADRSPPIPQRTSPTVAALLRTSLERLPPEVRPRFRLLGAFPSKPMSLDLFAASKIWDMQEPEDARDSVRELVNRGLLEPAEAGRFYLHPILSSYARFLLEKEEGGPNLQNASLKHAEHYEQLLSTLGYFYQQGGQQMMRALEIFDRERPHFEAGQRWAESRYGEDSDAARVLSGYGSAAPRLVLQRLKPSERRRWLEGAVSAAQQLRDEAARRGHEAILATAYLDTGETERAFEILERHLKDARDAGEREAEMIAFGNLGNAHGAYYDKVKAEECYREVLDLAQELDNLGFEAQALGALGEAHNSRGEHREAVRKFRRRLALARRIQDLRSQARALKHLGSSFRQVGRPCRASVLLRRSVEMFKALGDRNEQGHALNSLGTALAELEDPKEAKECFENARVLAQEEENTSLEAFAVGNLGGVAGELEGDNDRALGLYMEQLKIAKRAAEKTNQAIASWNIALAHWKGGRMPEAIRSGRDALRLYEETYDRRAEEVRERLREWES